MLEGKTANNIVDRYHRIITGDQNQIETNPNSVVTVTGTIGNPFGDITKEQFEEFAQKLYDKDMTIRIQSDLGACYVFGVPAQTDPPEAAIIGGSGARYNNSQWSAFELFYMYSTKLSLSGSAIINGSQQADLSLIEATVCTTTFIYHPIN